MSAAAASEATRTAFAEERSGVLADAAPSALRLAVAQCAVPARVCGHVRGRPPRVHLRRLRRPERPVGPPGLSFLPCGFGAAAAAAPAAAAAAVAASGGGSPQSSHAFDSAEATADFRKRQQRMMAELWKAHSYEHNVHIPLHIRVWQAQFGEEAAEAEAPPPAAGEVEETPTAAEAVRE